MINPRLIQINGEYFIKYDYIDVFDNVTKSAIFTDFNNEDLSLGTDKEFAEMWLKERQRIEGA